MLQTTVHPHTIVRMFIKGALAVVFCWTMANVRQAEGEEFTNMWVAQIHGGEGVAQRVARDLGYTYKGQAKFFEDHYVLTRDDHPDISPRGSHELTQALLDVEEVKWAQQQHILKRTTRENVPRRQLPNIKDDEEDSSSIHPSADKGTLATCQGGNNNKNTKEDKEARDTSKLGTFSTKPSAGKGTLASYKGVTKNIKLTSDKQSAYKDQFNDPLWYKQWNFQDYRTKPYPVMDHNVVPVYKMGITGKGITVAIVDDGLQGKHPDLEPNYDYDLSWDVAHDTPGSKPDPPFLNFTDGTITFHSHGTKCAGVVGMVANNGKCGVGVAYEAKLAGVKLLSSPYSPLTESTALQHKLETVDIYSNSWGPDDNGETMTGIEYLTDMALTNGVTKGRNGKGSIYTFAGGNGRDFDDNCGADGTTNHIHTIGVAAAGQDGKWAYYSERCSAIFTTAYSGTYTDMEQIVATDLGAKCDEGFSGTSAATPLVTGIIALTLQANPELTYRDVMHLITMSSEVAPLADNGDIWYKNGAGFWVSNDFGFGLLNAENMVTQAKEWKNVPKVRSCVVEFPIESPAEFTVDKDTTVTVRVDGCKGTLDAVRYLEHVLVTATVQYPYRGAITLTLISPKGTKTALLESRPRDSNTGGLKEWNLKSVHSWGEKPHGTWKMNIRAASVPGVAPATGTVSKINMTLYGTLRKPAHHSSLPREYAAFRLSNGKTSED